MRPTPNYEELDRLVEVARTQDPAPLSELVARRMVRHALGAASSPVTPERRSPWRVLWGLVAAFSLVCGLWLARDGWQRGTLLAVDQADHPLRIALLSGDAVTLAAGAQVKVLSQSARRCVRIVDGTALFDVNKLRPGEAFSVITQHVEVHVVGTVFSVSVSAQETLVRVYEGRVQLPNGILSAGSEWSSTSGENQGAHEDSLAAQARAAVEARLGRSLRASVQPLASGSPVLLAPPRAPLSTASSGGLSKAKPAPVLPAPASLPDLAASQRALEEGRLTEALQFARAALDTRPSDEPAWRELEADALRALGRFDEAIVAYERAASLASPPESLRLAHAGAALAFEGMHDAKRALALLDRFQLDAHQSPLRERATRLRVHVLLALRRVEEARRAARRYLAFERETAVSDEMRALLGW